MYWMGRFLCTAWALSMYRVDVSYETAPCLVPDITDGKTLQLKPFKFAITLYIM